MSLAWSSDFQIKTNHGNPASSTGPSVAANGAELVMVYLGSGGSNIWFSTCLTDQNTTPAIFTNWVGNTEIKDLNATMTAHSVPAIGMIAGKLTLLVPQQNACNVMLYQPGSATPWAAAGNTLAYGSGWKNPVLIEYGNVTHLFLCDSFDNLWWYTTNQPQFPNNGVILVKEAGASPSATIFNQQLYLSYWNTKAKVSALMKLAAPNGSWEDLSALKFQSGGTVNQGAAVVGFSQNLYLIYTYGKDPELWYTTVPTGQKPPLLLPNGTPIQFNGVTAKTTGPIAAIPFSTHLCVFHKGESDKLYLTYTV